MNPLCRLLMSFALVSLVVSSATADERPQSPVFPPFSMDNPIAEENLSDEDLKEMAAGEVIVRSRPVPEGYKGTHVMSAAMVPASVEEIFAAVIDCDSLHEFVPRLEECTNIYAEGADPATATTFDQYQKLLFSFAFIKREITYTNHMFLIRPHVIGWVLKEGDVDASEGYWRVIPYNEEQNILLYNVFNNPGIAIPTRIQESLTKRDLPGTVEAFRTEILARRAQQ